MATNVGIRIQPVTTDDYTAFRLVALRQFHAEDIADSPADEAFRNKRYPKQRIVAAWTAMPSSARIDRGTTRWPYPARRSPPTSSAASPSPPLTADAASSGS